MTSNARSISILILALILSHGHLHAQERNPHSNAPWATGLTLISDADKLYSKYREGTIKRHIAENGRFLQSVWLRTEDAADRGLVSWPTQSPVISVAANRRLSWDGGTSLHSWLPVVFYEEIPRTIPARYQKLEPVAYVAIEAASGRVPLYEWEHNTFKEKEADSFIDHYYSTNPHSLVARYRYHHTGIVAYLQQQAIPGTVPIFVGFDRSEMNHKLFTDKSNPHRLENVQQLGYAYSQPTGSFRTPLIEYRLEDSTCAPCRDNMYSAVSTGTIQGPRGRTIRRDRHFQARWVIAGGGDNPLYEGGLLLAVFSLEHLHGVSVHSLAYAKRLFDFIEVSEEQQANILYGSPNPSGMLRRSRHPWFHHPQNQMANGERWAASTDELVGVMMGLRYFERATRNADPVYNQRVKSLFGRVGQYLKDRLWVYADSRLEANVSAFLTDISMTEYGAGSLLFNYPFSRIFEDVLWHSYSGPETFEQVATAATDFIDAIGRSAAGTGIEFLLFAYPLGSCIAEFITEYTEDAGFVLGCGRNINTFSEVYELAIENAYPYVVKNGYTTDEFYNHTMLMYTAWMVLDADSVGADRKKTFAKKVLRYIRDMWGGAFNWYGIARKNALFAAVATRCFQLLNREEILDALDLDVRRGVHVTNFRQEVESVINEYVSTAAQWRPDLPLGEPLYEKIDGARRPQVPPRPWERQWPQAWQRQSANQTLGPGQSPLWFFGIGRGEAWRHGNTFWGGDVDAFRFYSSSQGKSAKTVFEEMGPWYGDRQGTWSLFAALENLKKCCRVGYDRTDAEYQQLAVDDGLFFKVEAGGVDLLIARMLLVAIGEEAAPRLVSDELFPVLPVPGETPW